MKDENILPKNLTQDDLDCIEFQVTAEMIKRFMDLTGDLSSLHTDREFARRSLYRDKVVHGMLPLLFISALKFCCLKQYRCSFFKISARFLKPIFANDRLLLSSKILEINQKPNQITLEYVLRETETKKILTTGNFSLGYKNISTEKNKAAGAKLSGSKQAMIMDSLMEQDLGFEQISKEDEKNFSFSISQGHARLLYEILRMGLASEHQFKLFEDWFSSCNSANLLSTCLFSTFVGMCLPGRHATFMDFQVTYHKPIQWDKVYRFTGKAGFKSPSTLTLVEDVAIYNPAEQGDIYAMGKINAKVNEPPTEMPSIDWLKNNETDLQLKDKVVLITGASRGIGETTAKLFSLYGARVVINYFQGKADADRVVGEINKAGGEALAIGADVSSQQEVAQMVSAVCRQYGTIHILVNNAVKDAYSVPFMELKWEDFQKEIDVTIKGAFNCCQQVLPLMLKNKGGKIINISSVFADNPVPNQAKYIVSKSGLVGLTRSLAVEFAPHNIQVNMVVPSIVSTDLSKNVSPMFLGKMAKDTPMQRNATAADVAKAVIFLSSSLASFTTGQKIMVTGGNPPF